MTRTMGIVVVALCISLCRWGEATTWYVDISMPEPGDGSSWEQAFQTIQAGIDAASDGDTAIVGQGIYVENIHFNGENIVLTSMDPADPIVVANTTIDGNQAGSVVTFSGSEDETCVLTGFTIRNGSALEGGGIDGGSASSQSLARIENNRIINNEASEGAGLGYCDGIIRNNVVADNTSRAGGYGHGLVYCDGVVEGNMIARNSAAGLHTCNGTIRNNVISANLGAGLLACDGIIENNTIVGNMGDQGGGLRDCKGTIRNCIIWGNKAYQGAQLYASSVPTYSCIEGWRYWAAPSSDSGVGSTSFFPYFVDPDNGDYRLKSWSPCIEAGDPSSDFSQEPDPNGGRINVGAYGNTSEATCASPDTDADELPDDWEIEFLGNLAGGRDQDPDGDLIVNMDEYYRGFNPTAPQTMWYVDASVSTSGDGTAWETAFKTIQQGIDAASDGETVLVAEGVYNENIHLDGKSIRLTSKDPFSFSIVANTVIDGGQNGSVVRFLGTEEPLCVLTGFTIRNGNARSGGGICGGGETGGLPTGVRTHATIQNNVIIGNRAEDDSPMRPKGGGGISDCNGTIQNNRIVSNISEQEGGGLSHCGGVIQNNCIRGNISRASGGGLYACSGEIHNNTIVANSADQEGGGLSGCSGLVRNCIIWGNVAAEVPSQLTSSAAPTFCCIEEWTGGGAGNIAVDPLFVDAQGTNYRLLAESPCVDAGLSYTWTAWPQRDRDGNCRLAGSAVDMGCYEYGSSRDSDGDLLADADEPAAGADAHVADTDGDGLRDGQEMLRGSDPGEPTLAALVHVPSDIPIIQQALFTAVQGDEIVVAPGTYFENLRFLGADVTLRSSDPEDPDVVAATILDGQGSGSVVTLAGSESDECALAGFTIQNGNADHGGGICGVGLAADWVSARHSRATIRKNTITGNAASSGGGLGYCDGLIDENRIVENTADSGGGLCGCDGTIVNNTIRANSAERSGGAVCSCDGVIQNNTITDNSAGLVGGGLDSCDGTVAANEISRNSASQGGGLSRCSGTIEGNTISVNGADQGGGLSHCDGIVRNNRVTGNSASGSSSIGGGLAWCEATIENNIISGNSAGSGGGLATCHGVIRNNWITENTARRSGGGGIDWCDGTISNNIIARNAASGDYSDGGGLCDCDGEVVNNTIVGNWAKRRGGGLYRCQGLVSNCIVWGNIAESWGQIDMAANPTYCCIEGGVGSGEGNVAFCPYFIDAEGGDYHLQPWSPCIDAGDPESPFSNEPQPNGGRVNMGAYGNTSEAAPTPLDTDGDGLPDDWELCSFGDLQERGRDDADGDRISNVTEYRYGWQPTVASDTLVESLTKGRRYQTIQVALHESEPGDEIVVYPGVYGESIYFLGKNVVLRSVDPADDAVVASTILDGNRRGSVVIFSGAEGMTCVLAGFTIRNGKALMGGGICGGTYNEHTHAKIRGNVIVGNSASTRGGGVVYCDGVIRDNLIAANSASQGGGLADCAAALEKNTIAQNQASRGGALYRCDGEITHNIIIENIAEWEYGGGLAECNGIIENNLIAGNTAEWSYGGAMAHCNGMIRNNTIGGNRAATGGGMSDCTGTIVNCILWGNEASMPPYQMQGSSLPGFSCIQGWTAGGGGNISLNPQFTDPDGPDDDPSTFGDNDYRLSSLSPCIDGGANEDLMWKALDLDANLRIWGGTVDMGAYEYGSPPFVFLGIVKPDDGPAQLTWTSRPGDTYLIWSCFDPSITKGWSVIATIPSQGLFTTWSDPSTTSPCKFYRIQIK